MGSPPGCPLIFPKPTIWSHAAAILTGVLLPLFGLLCIQAASTLYIRKFSNPLSCSGVFFFTGTLSSLALFCSTGKNAAFSVFFSAFLTGCMHDVNLIQVCMIPPFFKKQGNVSTVSGVLNSCCPTSEVRLPPMALPSFPTGLVGAPLF